jgi:hypothetical protein
MNSDRLSMLTVALGVTVGLVLVAVAVTLAAALRHVLKWRRLRRGDGREAMMASDSLRVAAVALGVAVGLVLLTVVLGVALRHVRWPLLAPPPCVPWCTRCMG